MRAIRYSFPANAAFAILLTFWLLSAVLPTQSTAQTFTVLYTFHGPDGAVPEGVLVRDAAGNLYGTTGLGGAGTNCPNDFLPGCGTAFMLNKAGKEVALFSFKGPNGDGPAAGLLRDASGNFYGTTMAGGQFTQACGGVDGHGCGVVFRLTKAGKEKLYQFKGSPDGMFPEAPLVEDPAGNFYGTTEGGGTHNCGTVFKINAAGKETILYSFTGGEDGKGPYTGVILDPAGNLYGVTAGGGTHNVGVVYLVDPSGKETVLYNFTGGSDGGVPFSVLLLDGEGNLYGTTQMGGNTQCGLSGSCGVVFELSPQLGGSWKETVLYAFCSLANCADGQDPGVGPLVRDAAGNFYGTTAFGGTFPCFGDGCGVVFELTPSGKETVLYDFTGGSDGEDPSAGLTIDDSGNLYGSASVGADTSCAQGGCGTVFEITP